MGVHVEKPAPQKRKSLLDQILPERPPRRRYRPPEEYRVVENVRHYSDGMDAAYSPNWCTRVLSAVTLGLWMGWGHVLLFLFVASFWSRAALVTLVALFATTLLPARPLLWRRATHSYLFLCWRRYFHFSFLFERNVSAAKDYVIAQFPHGSYPLGQLLGGTFMATEYEEHKVHCLAAPAALSVPLWRNAHAWLGALPANAENFHRLLDGGANGVRGQYAAANNAAALLELRVAAELDAARLARGDSLDSTSVIIGGSRASSGISVGVSGGGGKGGGGTLLARRGSGSSSLSSLSSGSSGGANAGGGSSSCSSSGRSSIAGDDSSGRSSPERGRSRRGSDAGCCVGGGGVGGVDVGAPLLPPTAATAAAVASSSPRSVLAPRAVANGAARAASVAPAPPPAPQPSTSQAPLLRRCGCSVGVMVGGIAEMFMQFKDREQIKLRDRKGFVRIALEHGSDILPVYMFGNSQVLSFGPPWLMRASRRVRASLGMLYGAWGLPVPRRVPIFMCVGAPVSVGAGMRPTDPGFEERVDEVHARVVSEITRVYYEHRAEYGWGDRELTVV